MVLSAPEAHQGHLQPRHVGLHLRGARPPERSSRCPRLLSPTRWLAGPCGCQCGTWHSRYELCRATNLLESQECRQKPFMWWSS